MMPMSYFEGKGEEIVIKAPKYSVYNDYDYLGFTFNGKHACEDLGIYRVSSSNRYQEELNPERKERTAEAPGADYTYYLGETFGPRKFKVDFAFERLDESKIKEIRDCFDDKEIHALWFDEAPYKVYEAKVEGMITLKTLPFDDGSGGIVYSGEGTVNFVCYCPYARTPDWVEKQNGTRKDGRNIDAYIGDNGFKNVSQWQAASRLQNELYAYGKNFGDIPAPFIFCDTTVVTKLPSSGATFPSGEKALYDISNLRIGDGEINYDILDGYKEYCWNSYTGLLVTKKSESDKKIVHIYGSRKETDSSAKSISALPVSKSISSVERVVTWNQYRHTGSFTEDGIDASSQLVTYFYDTTGTFGYDYMGGTYSTFSPSAITLKYHYWYY